MYPVHTSSHTWLIPHIRNRMVGPRLRSLDGTVLDIGCGERPFEADILQYADRDLGLDWSDSLHNLKADVVADANRPLPIGSAPADHAPAIEMRERPREPAVTLFAACAGTLSGTAKGRVAAAHPQGRP